MQIRMSVYILEDLASKSVSYLYGASYYVPLINMFPFINLETATSAIKETYQGYGFSQVIESYLNFGAFGIILFFGIVGYLLGSAESKVKTKSGLAYLASVTCILINATRNHFAFVPGQIFIVTLVYFAYTLKVNKDANREEKHRSL